MKYEFGGNKKLGFINNPSILDTQKYLFLEQTSRKTSMKSRIIILFLYH